MPVQETEAGSPFYARWYPWYVVGILSAAATMSYVDRQVLYLLTEAIKQDLVLTDVEISLLQGLAFGLFYSLMAVPLGYVSDRVPRRALVGVGIFLWSLATASCGLVRSFWGLFSARLGVGIGEATLLPSTQSLLPDYFDSKRLPRAFAVFQIGTYLGVALAYAGGGLVYAWVSGWDLNNLPVVGTLKPWQMTFLLAAAPGPLIAILMLTVREPQRIRNPLLSDTAQASGGFGEFLSSRRLFLIGHLGSTAASAIVGYGVASWVPSFFIRTFGWTTAEIGIVYGSILLFVSGGGTLFGGHIARRWIVRDRSGALHQAVMWSLVLLVPLGVAFPLVGNAYMALVCLGGFQFFIGSYSAMMPSILQFATPRAYRGRAAGLYVLMSGAVGAAMGPVSVAMVTQYILKDTQRLNQSISIIVALGAPVMIALLGLAYREFTKLTVPGDGES